MCSSETLPVVSSNLRSFSGCSSFALLLHITFFMFSLEMADHWARMHKLTTYRAIDLFAFGSCIPRTFAQWNKREFDRIIPVEQLLTVRLALIPPISFLPYQCAMNRERLPTGFFLFPTKLALQCCSPLLVSALQFSTLMTDPKISNLLFSIKFGAPKIPLFQTPSIPYLPDFPITTTLHFFFMHWLK